MRRLVLSSLTVAGLMMATTAVAQQPVAEPQAAPAAEAAPAQPVAQPAPPAVEAPAAPAVVEAPPPPPPPPAPTDATSIAVLGAMQRICQPLVAGGDLEKLGPAAGFKKKKDLWILQYAKGYQITVSPPGTNPSLCMLEVEHPIDGITPVIVDLHNWAMAQHWKLYRNDKYVTDRERSTRSWENRTDTADEAIVLVTSRKADGTPLNKKTDHTELLYSLQKK